jgi:hypothetical protein
MQKTILMLLILALAGCAPRPDVTFKNIEVFNARLVMPPAGTAEPAAAAYMLIKNGSQRTDELLSVSTVIGEASLHETSMVGGVASMDPIYSIKLPSGASVELKPGSYHILVTGLEQGLKPGDIVQLTLHFEKAGEMIVPLKVSAQ